MVPCCLASSSCNRVPTRGPLANLCKKGLGILWFCNEDRLQIPTYYTPEEVHYVVVTLYPLLRNICYEFCKATGPGNNVLVPLSRPNSSRLEAGPSALIHTPVFSADQLKGQVGRKGRLYIRPCQNIIFSLGPNSTRTRGKDIVCTVLVILYTIVFQFQDNSILKMIPVSMFYRRIYRYILLEVKFLALIVKCSYL